MVSNGDIRVFYIAKWDVFSRDLFPKIQNDLISLALFAVTDIALIHLATRRQQALKLAFGDQARASKFS
jgi:hypothetical protein